MLYEKRIANLVRPPLETHTTVRLQNFVFPECYLTAQETGQSQSPNPPIGYMVFFFKSMAQCFFGGDLFSGAIVPGLLFALIFMSFCLFSKGHSYTDN